MSRIRTIKPEFADSESMSHVSRDARLLFVLLWTQADDEGRMRGASRYIASKAFPYDDVAESIDGWLDELEREGCITRYEVDGKHYLAITNWVEHQRIEKKSSSRLPAPTGNGTGSPAETVVEPSSTSPGAVVEDSGSPRGVFVEDSGKPPGTVMEPSSPRARAPDLGPRTMDQGPSTKDLDQPQNTSPGETRPRAAAASAIADAGASAGPVSGNGHKAQPKPRSAPTERAWAPFEEAVSKALGGIRVVNGRTGCPLSWVGELCNVAGQHSGGDVRRAVALWDSFVSSEEWRFRPRDPTGLPGAFGAWVVAHREDGTPRHRPGRATEDPSWRVDRIITEEEHQAQIARCRALGLMK